MTDNSRSDFENAKMEAFLNEIEETQKNTKDFDEKEFFEYLANRPRFDMNAQDIDEWLWMQEFIPGIIVSSAGGSVPFQAQGLIHGLPFYYRDRHGYADFRVGPADGDDVVLNHEALYSASCKTEEFMGQETFFRNWLYLIPRLSRAQTRYEFKGRQVEFTYEDRQIIDVFPMDREYSYYGWGMDAAEARASLDDFWFQLPSELSTPPEKQTDIINRWCEYAAVSMEPHEPEVRIFPNPEPTFTVRNVPLDLLWSPEDDA